MEEKQYIDKLTEEVDKMKFDLDEWIKNNEIKNDSKPEGSIYFR